MFRSQIPCPRGGGGYGGGKWAAGAEPLVFTLFMLIHWLNYTVIIIIFTNTLHPYIGYNCQIFSYFLMLVCFPQNSVPHFPWLRKTNKAANNHSIYMWTWSLSILLYFFCSVLPTNPLFRWGSWTPGGQTHPEKLSQNPGTGHLWGWGGKHDRKRGLFVPIPFVSLFIFSRLPRPQAPWGWWPCLSYSSQNACSILVPWMLAFLWPDEGDSGAAPEGVKGGKEGRTKTPRNLY